MSNKPIVSYWKTGDPCYKISMFENKLTEINVFNTKRLSDEFIDFCIKNKSKIYLHINITGMGKTIFEPNIPTVKETFLQIKKFIDSGFPITQILICVDPILPNENGLKALKLLLRVFTEFKQIRFRFVRFNVLRYKESENSKFTVANPAISKRSSLKPYMMYLIKSSHFLKEYYELIDSYSSIISVDKGDEATIGIRELIAFGYKNEYTDPTTGEKSKIIEYEKNNKYKPVVKLLSVDKPTRCKNRCLLCPNFG